MDVLKKSLLPVGALCVMVALAGCLGKKSCSSAASGNASQRSSGQLTGLDAVATVAAGGQVTVPDPNNAGQVLNVTIPAGVSAVNTGDNIVVAEAGGSILAGDYSNATVTVNGGAASDALFNDDGTLANNIGIKPEVTTIVISNIVIPTGGVPIGRLELVTSENGDIPGQVSAVLPKATESIQGSLVNLTFDAGLAGRSVKATIVTSGLGALTQTKTVAADGTVSFSDLSTSTTAVGTITSVKVEVLGP